MNVWKLAALGFAVQAAAIGGVSGAAVITVTTTTDVLANDGLCSLREAVIAAGSNAPSGPASGECPSGNSGSMDTIEVPAGTYRLTIPPNEESPFEIDPAVGDLDLEGDLEIVGAGIDATTIDATGLSRVFHVDDESASMKLADLEIRGGATTGRGGGVLVDDLTSLEVTRGRIVGCVSGSDGGGLSLQNVPNIEIRESEILSNQADDDGGGIYWWSGDLLLIERSLIAGNQTTGGFGADGGGVSARSSNSDTLVIRESVIHSNSADGDGGGLRVDCSLQLTRSTVSSNSSDFGGGISFDFPGPSRLENSTISGNSAEFEGGGLWMISNNQVTLIHSTIAENDAPVGSAVSDGDDLVAQNSILSGTCAGAFLSSMGGNIESPGDNCGLNQPSDQTAVPAGALMLGPLQDNGGLTWTHRPSVESVAIDTALSLHCLDVDQRRVGRPQASGCDVGSVENDTVLFVDGFESGDTSAWSGASIVGSASPMLEVEIH